MALAEVKQRLPFVTMSIIVDPILVKPVGTAIILYHGHTTVQDKALVDTGSMFSMLRKAYTYLLGTGTDKFHDTTLSRYRFLAANGTPITIYGSVAITIALPMEDRINKTFTHDFFIADVSDNIVGYDFLQRNALTFNPCTETIAKVSQINTECDESETRVVKLGGITSSMRLHSLGEHCKFGNKLTNTATTNQMMSHEEGRDYRTVGHKSTQTPKSMYEDKERRKVHFAQPLEERLNIKDWSEFKRDHYDPAVHEIIVEGNDLPLLVEFARRSRLASVQPRAVQKYLRTVHALTASDDLDEGREQLVNELQTRFPDVFSLKLQEKNKAPVKLYITTCNEHTYRPPHIYPVPNAYRERVKETIDEMIQQGVLRHSKSHYAAPLTCVKKKDGSIRVCTDFRALNAIIKQDKYVIPHIDYIKKHILGNVFTTLDLKNGFQQVMINEADRHKTAMATPWGLLEYCRMPFGLKNALNCFQRFMNIILYGLKNIFIYIDDIIIFSEDLQQHKRHVIAVFERLNQYGLIINHAKSHFCKEQIEYLGLEFSAEGYRAVSNCELKLRDMAKPRTVKEVQKFLGMVNYYRTHIPNLAELAAPLYDLCQKSRSFEWLPEHDESFCAIIDLYQKRLSLAPLKPKGQLEVYTDASDVACGAVLLQDKRPIEFYSKKFSPAEQRYSCHERETFGLVSAVLHFRHILIGEEFVVYTDHKPLVYWLQRPPVNERHARWMVKVQGLHFTIKYVEGAYNFVADVLSRPSGLEKVSYQELHDHIKLNAIQLHFLSEELKVAQTKEFVQSCKIPESQLETHEGYQYVNHNGNLKLLIPPSFAILL